MKQTLQIIKKSLFFITLISIICCSSFADTKTYVRDRAYPLNKRLKEAPKLEAPQSFSIVVIGDSQSYVKFDFNQGILEFKPDGKTVSVSTYSPFFGLSPRTERLAWNKSPQNKFTFTIE